MKRYIVKWNKEEKDFDNVHEAVYFAEKTCEYTGAYVSVWTENNGVMEEQPFFYAEWEI